MDAVFWDLFTCGAFDFLCGDVGAFVGVAVGVDVDSPLGAALGADVGAFVGVAVGVDVGSRLGAAPVGVEGILGAVFGDLFTCGAFVFLCGDVGAFVGVAVGVDVG